MAYDTFERELRLIVNDLSPESINAELAKYAKKSLNEVISSGRASKNYTRYVNGIRGASEESVKAPGPIIYDFSLWEPIITFAISELQKRSPVKSGRFRSSYVVLADQKIVTDYDSIPPSAEVIITNSQPYIRKVEAGIIGKKRGYVFDGAKNACARQFGSSNSGGFSFETVWLDISNGLIAGVPYILKRNGSRKDRQAGMPITYPAIVINQVD